jgi:adenylosuccinate synthase
MKPRAIVLSGRICSGKSTLAAKLTAELNATPISSKDVLLRRLSRPPKTPVTWRREAERVERETDGEWLSDPLNRLLLAESTTPAVAVVDSVMTAKQVQHIRQGGWSVLHVHLGASEQTLTERFNAIRSEHDTRSYRDLATKSAAKQIDDLAKMADVVIDTDRCNSADVYARIVARTEIRPATAVPLVDVLVGGQYGSEGKGNIANYLAPEYDILVRVGGPNAGHVVFRSGDSPYTFRQLPSGALANRNAKLVIGAGAVIDLNNLKKEIAELSISYEKLVVDPQAMIIDEQDVAWEVENLKQAIGSTAQGVGRATARKILNRVPNTDVKLAKDIPELKHYVGDSLELFAKALSAGQRLLLEGTQGTSLSIHHGHYPHVTSRVTTAAGCLAEAGISARHTRRVIMVCRTYPIRVGNTETGNTSGYMSKEITIEEISRRSRVPIEDLRKTEKGSVSGRPRRIAEFDWAQLRRALVLNGPTDIALTFVDYFDVDNRKSYRYEQLSPETLRFVEELEKVSGIPVSMLSTAFNDRNIIDRRMW